MEADNFALIRQAQTGDEAAGDRLIRENSALVWSIARRFFGRGVDPEDLYQLGCVGFLKAVQGFDTAYGITFKVEPYRCGQNDSSYDAYRLNKILSDEGQNQ